MSRRARLIRYSENARWFFEHLGDLRQDPRYSGTFVAIDNGKVIAFHEDLDVLSSVLESFPERESAEAAMVDYVSEQPCAMLL